jgi:hypothetical protein
MCKQKPLCVAVETGRVPRWARQCANAASILPAVEASPVTTRQAAAQRYLDACRYSGEMLSLHPMTEEHLPAVEAWLRSPHVARWWTPDPTAEAEIAKYRERVRPDSSSETTC